MSSAPLQVSIRTGCSPTPSSWPASAVTSIAALGDLMLAGEWDEVTQRGEAGKAFHDLAQLCDKDDLLFANLEATTDGGGGTISKQPRLIGELATLTTALDVLGVNLACLANNHTFDAEAPGFESVRRLLDERKILHLGAGRDSTEASRCLVTEHGGVSFGWLAYTALDTKPSHVATEDGYGVNPLNEETAQAEIKDLRNRVDHVLVSLHWGVEFCHLPSPDQIQLARRLIDCGASLVIGHHAHVIQGTEAWGAGAIAYNLGNTVTTDLTVDGRLAIRQSNRTRSSYLLRAAFSKERLEAIELVPLRAPYSQVLVGDEYAGRILQRATRRLARGVTAGQWKRRRFYEDVVLRTLRKLHPRVIRSVRPKHFANFFKNISFAIRGRGPA